MEEGTYNFKEAKVSEYKRYVIIQGQDILNNLPRDDLAEQIAKTEHYFYKTIEDAKKDIQRWLADGYLKPNKQCIIVEVNINTKALSTYVGSEPVLLEKAIQ